MDTGFITTDGVNFLIQEPSPFSAGWFSHKFKGAALLFEVASFICFKNVVWVDGPFMAGSFSNLKMFRCRFKASLLQLETVIADRGYRDEKVVTPWILHANKNLHSRLRACHEALNGDVKFSKI